MNQTRRLLIVLAIVAPAMIATAVLLGTVFGPTDAGLRCTRIGRNAQCEVLQTRVLGLFGDTSFSIPESQILGAMTLCAHSGIGAHAAPNCTVNILLKSGPYRSYSVLSSPVFDVAEASTIRLNAYFADRQMAAIALNDSYLSTVLLFAGLPLLLVAAVLAFRRVRRPGLQPRRQQFT